MKKDEVYKRIKIAGMISYIPIILITGPLMGYFFGDYLEKKYGWASYITLIAIGMGFLTSIIETIRIIKIVSRIEAK